jgi:hypothetical protein
MAIDGAGDPERQRVIQIQADGGNTFERFPAANGVRSHTALAQINMAAMIPGNMVVVRNETHTMKKKKNTR